MINDYEKLVIVTTLVVRRKGGSVPNRRTDKIIDSGH